MATVYCFDTSALLDAGVRSYPRATFRSLWEKFEALIATGRIIAPEDVLAELKRKDDEMASWGKRHRNIFVPLDEEIQERVQGILADFPRLARRDTCSVRPYGTCAVAEGVFDARSDPGSTGGREPCVGPRCKRG